VLHEKLTVYMVLGGILVLLSTLLITVYEEHQKKQSVSVSKPGARA
jgi:drug/metabolite transporter (DMT)-like permease